MCNLRLIQACRKKGTVSLTKEVQVLKCSSAKVHIYLSWQGVEGMDT